MNPYLAPKKFASFGELAVTDEGKRTLFGVDCIERYVACINRLIGDLVDVTSVDAGKFVVHPRPGDVVEMISEAIAAFAQSAQEKGLSLEAWRFRQAEDDTSGGQSDCKRDEIHP